MNIGDIIKIKYHGTTAYTVCLYAEGSNLFHYNQFCVFKTTGEPSHMRVGQRYYFKDHKVQRKMKPEEAMKLRVDQGITMDEFELLLHAINQP